MNVPNIDGFKKILQKHGAKPSKGLGQNFLTDKNVLTRIIESSGIKPDDIVLEVGPGPGVLTKELAKKAGRVIAVEKDAKMLPILQETLLEFKNVEIVCADILSVVIPDLIRNPYKIVANIPYYLTSPLIRKFLEEKNPPQEMILMVQKEVAQRICAKPGKMSLLAVSVQYYAEAGILFEVSKNCFWPSPKVDSAVIKITPYPAVSFPRPLRQSSSEARKRESRVSAEIFFKTVKAGFSQPRKQLANNLSKSLKISREKTEQWLLQNGIDPKQRAETLSVQDWQNLANSL